MNAFKATAFAFNDDNDLKAKKDEMIDLISRHYKECMEEIESIKNQYNLKVEELINKVRF